MAGWFGRLRKRHWFDELAGILLLLLAGILLLSIATYAPTDSTWFYRQPEATAYRNLFGRVGATLAEILLQALGTASFLAPVVLATTGWNRFIGKSAASSYGRLVGFGAMVLLLSGAVDLWIGHVAFRGEVFPAGGLVGRGTGGALRALLGSTGGLIVAFVLLAGTVVLTTRFSFARTSKALAAWFSGRWRERFAAWRVRRAERLREKQRRAVERKHAKAAAGREKVEGEPAPLLPLAIELAERSAAVRKPAISARPAAPRPAPAKQAPLPMDTPPGGIALPPLELLNEPQPQKSEEERDLVARGKQLEDKFREFDVAGSVVAIHPGPVVTTYEFQPEAGVKLSKITNLEEDLSLGLRAESVRIERIHGSATVGIEVPNRHQEIIYPRELLGSERFRSSRSKLTLALGKDINGDVFCAELDRMPHLLIAGATGAGKSVGLNGMIASILYKATPAEVRFIMIDTKMIELGIYQDIPHLLIPVVTDPKHASNALKWAVREMESRYKKLASVGVRHLDQYNDVLAAEPGRTMTDEKTGKVTPLDRLPYIVVVVDELADLMMVAARDVMESIMRLAQMARAVGIHLILATQRPSVDVIDGTIKANFPSRIAFRVSQSIDSRTIIDQQGAEYLLGRGDMLFLTTGGRRLVRVHGGYVTEQEINRITAFLKKQARPVFDETVLKDPEEERGSGPGGEERDAMYLEAVSLVLNEGMCSITLIQRRLRLGYARAARIVDMMEQDGIVGKGDGAKPREILVGPEILETLRSTP